MIKLHIAQDDFGYWMLSLEKEDGTMTLLAYQFPTPDHLIENAHEMVAERGVEAVVLVDPPTRSAAAPATGATREYQRPTPKKARA
jgi:hypothetical protein